MSIRSNVDARALDQRIAFERRVELPTGTGGTTISWVRLGPSPTAEYWARVDGAKANEPYVADGIRSESDYTFWVRSGVAERISLVGSDDPPGLVLTDRIVWDGRPFNISDMPDQQLRGRLRAIVARTGLNEG